MVGAGFVVTQQVGGFNATRLGRLLKAVDALLVTAFGDNAWHDGEVAPFFEALGSQKGGRAEVLVRQVPMRHTGTPRTWPPAAGSPLLLSPEINRSCVCSEPPESSSVRPKSQPGHCSSARLLFPFASVFCVPTLFLCAAPQMHPGRLNRAIASAALEPMIMPYEALSASAFELHLEGDLCYGTEQPGGSGRDGIADPDKQSCDPACNCFNFCYSAEVSAELHKDLAQALHMRLTGPTAWERAQAAAGDKRAADNNTATTAAAGSLS